MYAISIAVLVGIAVAVWGVRLVLIASKPAPERLQLAQPPIYTHHAQERMKERGVLPDLIEMTLAQPSGKYYDRSEGSVRFEREIAGRILKVWLVAERLEAGEMVVKTTAWADPHRDIQVPDGRMGMLIGREGVTINGLRRKHGVRIQVCDESLVRIFSADVRKLETAAEEISTLTKSTGRVAA